MTRVVAFGKRSAAPAAPAPPRPAPAAAPQQRTPRGTAGCDAHIKQLLAPQVAERYPAATTRDRPRGELAHEIQEMVVAAGEAERRGLDEAQVRDTVTALLNELIAAIGGLNDGSQKKAASASKSSVVAAKDKVHPLLMQRVDPTAVADMGRAELAEQISEVVSEILAGEKINLNQMEQRDLVTLLLNDMLGLGPLEPLLADEAVTEIMVNSATSVYAERAGKLSLTDVQFRDEQHLLNIAQRIVSAIGRRVDESSPICDARLMDGSRVNVIIPPLAIDGTSISIRKFSKQKLTLEKMMEFGSMTPKMCRLLNIAGRCRMNIIISGGTGSGKTTMLGAISRNIDPGERVVTIEDAAELQLQQPHVVRLETRPANLEGNGAITMRDLVKNALRMRPDRIILGEVRGGEAFDLLAAMNTGHDGSLGTLHANRPREAITRLENMINMAGLNLPAKAIRQQIADAVQIIVQVSRMRDGKRRTTHISEIVGMEGDVITMQDLYTYEVTGEGEDGLLRGEHVSAGLRPNFYERAEYYGLGRALMECI